MNLGDGSRGVLECSGAKSSSTPARSIASDAHVFDRRITGRGARVVDHEGPEHEPGHGRGYRLLRAPHFAGEAEHAAAAPDERTVVAQADVPGRAELHAHAAGVALSSVDAKEPAEQVPDVDDLG